MPLSSAVSWNLLKFMYIESVMLPNHLIFCWPLILLLSIFPSIIVFFSELAFKSRGQSIGATASSSGLLMNIQGLFPLGLTGLISLQSKGLSRDFSNTTIYPLALSLLYGPTLTLYMMSGKNHSFYYVDLSQQSNVSTL